MRIQDISHLETEKPCKSVSRLRLHLTIHTVRPLQFAEMAKVRACDHIASSLCLLRAFEVEVDVWGHACHTCRGCDTYS